MGEQPSTDESFHCVPYRGMPRQRCAKEKYEAFTSDNCSMAQIEGLERTRRHTALFQVKSAR